jgi:hypothetical protein
VDGVSVMKMIAEYLEHAVHFEQMAADTVDEELKETLLAQASAYHKMAAERTKRLNVKLPPRSQNTK